MLLSVENFTEKDLDWLKSLDVEVCCADSLNVKPYQAYFMTVNPYQETLLFMKYGSDLRLVGTFE